MFKEKKGKSYAPFSKVLTQDEIDGIMTRSMKQTERYRLLKKEGKSAKEIEEIFNTPVEMQVFTYDGLKDTTLSPMDSIRWQKYFLRCGFMSMDPHSGHVKAYVGGPDFSNFQYDMVNKGKRQVGSTVKPYLYTLAMSEGMWPCDKTVKRQITLVDGNGNAVNGKGEGHKAVLGHFTFLEGSAGIADLHEALAHLLHAHAGTAARNGDANVAVEFHNRLCGLFHDRDMGSAASDVNGTLLPLEGIQGSSRSKRCAQQKHGACGKNTFHDYLVMVARR